jgi:hypothetical protein
MADFGIAEGLAVAGVVASTAAAGASAYGQYQQVQAANNASAYNQQVALYQQQQAVQLGKVQQQQSAQQTSALEGRQAAAYAGAGIDPDSGTPATLESQTAGYGALDSLAIKQQAASQAWGYGNTANLAGMKAVNPYGAAGTSLLTSGSQVGSQLSRAYGSGLYGSTSNSSIQLGYSGS